jgi:ubiquinone/menaquinone biosynthesis C-methylase UbiE
VADFLSDTRRSYDVSAADYAEWIAGELAVKPLDRAVLTAFAELVEGRVADVGCGTGRITAFLQDRGVQAFGIDLSPAMVAEASRRHPTLHFAEGTMTELPIEDESLGGLVTWYSTIHIPDTHLPAVLAEFHRTLAPGGYAQLAFQVGNEPEHRTKAGQHAVALTFHHRQPDQVAEQLEAAGLRVQATLVRAPDDNTEYPETTPQGYILARKPQPPASRLAT